MTLMGFPEPKVCGLEASPPTALFMLRPGLTRRWTRSGRGERVKGLCVSSTNAEEAIPRLNGSPGLSVEDGMTAARPTDSVAGLRAHHRRAVQLGAVAGAL